MILKIGYILNPAPNNVWVCDFTYIRAAGGFYYHCIILDLFSRKVTVYKLSNKIDTKLAIDTVNAAVAAMKFLSAKVLPR